MQFVVVRLGKDSIEDIARLDAASAVDLLPFNFHFICTQVEDGIAENDYVFIWLGSDNSKGQPTSWKQGIRAIGRIVTLDRGPKFNDESNIEIKVVAIFPTSIDQFDFLERSASYYKYFAQYPVVGVRSFRNNAIQKVNEGDRQKTSALLTALSILFPAVRDQLARNAPELLDLLNFIPVGDTQAITAMKPNIADADEVWEWVSTEIFKKEERNLLFLGPPGTGKTWYAHEVAKKLADGDEDRLAFVQFHPSFSYDDFVEGYSPRLNQSASTVEYTLRNKHFLELSAKAKSDGSNLYVIVIDELTRGDPSRVFGELLTYLEVDHRNREFSLAYSGAKTFVPKNLVVIATANPYDRSVGELDDALIRRFAMREFPPDAGRLKLRFAENQTSEALANRLLHVFDLINARVPVGFGHSHFWNVRTEDDFHMLWKSRLSFLLKRSFLFDDDGLAALVAEIESVFPRTDSAAEASSIETTLEGGEQPE